MPTGKAFLERLATLENKVENLMSWQRWQMVLLGSILVAIVLKRFN